MAVSRWQAVGMAQKIAAPERLCWPSSDYLSEGHAVSLHRTFLAADGPGKAPVDSPKKLISATTDYATRGASIKLTPARSVFCIGEVSRPYLRCALELGYPVTTKHRGRYTRAGNSRGQILLAAETTHADAKTNETNSTYTGWACALERWAR